jgi:phage shock protein PspC (stress-responsive transcriptional regulator)
MNEVTKIHLGRTAFPISAEAHRELQNYLDAIRKHVSDESVVGEIELRMAELLGERGINGDKVVLPADVEYLKEQLGNPKDFADEDTPEQATDKSAEHPKRLFRDTGDAMLAGVASGLANYFGIDPMIVRLLFVITSFMGGWGLLIYIVLWLLDPEAKSPSDRLQMAGKPVTIDSLKEVVERADVKGAAQRANKSLAGPVNTGFKALLQIIGVALVALGLALLLSLVAGGSYAFLRSGAIVQDSIFPVGLKEHLVVYIAAGVGAIISLFIVLFGMAMFQRKWPIRPWITGILVGLLFAGLAVGGALTADVVPQVRDRYNANIHTTTYSVQPFTKVNLDNVDETVSYEYSPNYSISLRYFGHPDLSTVKYTVSNNVLSVNSRQFDQQRSCNGLCLPDDFNMTVVIRAPKMPAGFYPGVPDAPTSPAKPGVLQS